MLALPRSARLASWASAWLAGLVRLDEVVAQVCADDEPHRVAGIPGQPGEIELATALETLRRLGATALRLALPASGDPLGLAGPPALTGEAVLAGEAAVAVGAPAALVPRIVAFGPPGDVGHLVTWHWHQAAGVGAAPDTLEAERALSEELMDAADTLARLGVAAWRPQAGEVLTQVRDGTPTLLPPVYPPRAQALAARAARLRAVLDLALDDDGGALSVSAATARRAALRPLEAAARRALVAACALAPDRP